MVSGIGPSATLKSAGIKVISDLASVGQNICLWYRTLSRWWFRVIGWEKLPDAVRANLISTTQPALEAFPSNWPEVEYLALGGVLGYWYMHWSNN